MTTAASNNTAPMYWVEALYMEWPSFDPEAVPQELWQHEYASHDHGSALEVAQLCDRPWRIICNGRVIARSRTVTG